MKKPKILCLIYTIALFLALSFPGFSLADGDPPADLKTYSKADIQKIAGKFVNNNLNINEPAIVDVNGDNIFDILNFSEEGNVEFYKNTGTNEEPVFVLEDANYGEVGAYNSFFDGMPVPVFFADADGDNDVDLFAVMDKTFDSKTNTVNYDVKEFENAMFFDNITLITIVLILAIVVLLIIIIR